MLMLKSVNFEQREFQIHQLEKSQPEQTEWIIGRNTTCDLVLASPEVSRIHGRIVYIDSSYYFIDVGSASGSVLNGELVPVDEPRQLRAGDLLQLGETFLHVETLAPPVAIEPALTAPTPLLPTQVWEKEDLFCRCCRIVQETPDVKTFYFVAEPAVQFCYQPGQFVNLEVTINGKPVIRPYSISSSPTRPYHLSITVKRVPSPPNQPELPPGLVSNWLHDHLKVGNCVRIVGGAMGHFTCVPNVPAKLLLVSAGSGITPMMSMLRWIHDTLTQCDIIFLHSAAFSEDIVFRKELEAIAAQMPNLRLAITLTRSHHDWMGLTGRISRSMLSFVVPDLLDRAVYVCGSEDFMQSIRTLLDSMEFPMQHYQEESFGGQLSKPTAAPIELQQHDLSPAQFSAPDTVVIPKRKASSPVIHFTQSAQQASTDGSTSILEVAEQEGVQIRYACRAGACGMCKVKVRKGQVRYQKAPSALTIADQQEGYVLSCIAYPAELLEIEA